MEHRVYQAKTVHVGMTENQVKMANPDEWDKVVLLVHKVAQESANQGLWEVPGEEEKTAIPEEVEVVVRMENLEMMVDPGETESPAMMEKTGCLVNQENLDVKVKAVRLNKGKTVDRVNQDRTECQDLMELMEKMAHMGNTVNVGSPAQLGIRAKTDVVVMTDRQVNVVDQA